MRCTLLVALALCAATAVASANESPEEATAQRISKLIAQLGDAQFAVRQRAQSELVDLGTEAFDALIEAEKSDDPEVAMQAGYLVRQIRAQWTRDTDPRAIQLIFKDYEVQGDEARGEKIEQLAALPGDAGLEFLCRLVRFERSPVLSKQAALAIIKQTVPEEAWKARAETIKKLLEQARRPAARWLEAYVQAHTDPSGALVTWSQLATDEQATLERHPQETRSRIVLDLLRQKIDLLDRLGRGGETEEVMRQMVQCERGDSDSLAELIEWLTQRKAWAVIDLVATRFAASFEIDAVLTYCLCEARLAQGETKLAEQTAEKALQVSGDSQQDHTTVADLLSKRGMSRWADREWQQAITLGPVGTRWDIDARRFLANSHHDRGHDLAAGEVLKQLLDAAEKDPAVVQRIRAAQQQPPQVEISLNSLRSSMNYYLACHAGIEKDRAKQLELLEKALEQDQANVEALIALYQATQDDAQRRAELVKLIREFVEACRAQIEDSPELPGYYNQVAWIVANTEGDLDEALRLSQKSVELARALKEPPARVGGLLDTLGHCYFAKKDYARAVKTQEEAARLDPQTASIGRALTRFRAALAEQQAK